MRVVRGFLLLAASVGALHGPHEDPIPEVESAVASVLTKFHEWPAYHGPTGTAVAALKTPVVAIVTPAATPTGYWLEQIQHQGISAFNPDKTYQIFRNVKDFGAKGQVSDGTTDDTAAIQSAMSSGNRCAPGKCQSTTITPAVVYFPSGTYLISSSIIDYYYTQIIGNPNDLPILKATPNFNGFGLIDGDQYQAGGFLGFGATNVFYRQIRNLVLDMTSIPSTSAATGVHWPTAQATSIQNVVFLMSDAPGSKHQGLFLESGSAGFINDLVFRGGRYGMNVGNQQYTMRNITFYNAVTAINLLFDWGWTFKTVNVINCTVALDMTSGGSNAQAIGSVTFIDSTITDTQIGFNISHTATSRPATAGSLIIENVQLNNVPIAIQAPGNFTVLTGSKGSAYIAAYGDGHEYIPNGPINFAGSFQAFPRPASLLAGNKYYERSKPHYENVPLSQFASTRSAGAKGDGVTDDTKALQNVIDKATAAGQIVFFDAGTYKITDTLKIPPGARVVGETYPVIMSSGPKFNDINDPLPVVRVGFRGQRGAPIEWSDMIVSTQGAQAGAILIEYNLFSDGAPAGMWDVHTRVGGFAGSQLQLADCPKTPTVMTPPAPVNPKCIAAYMSMRITPTGGNVYLENNWFWVADHDIDSSDNIQITIYAGRGLLIDSFRGPIWLIGTAVEHHTLYQYQLLNTQNLFMGQIQTETAYYQPNPNATIPFPIHKELSDPDFVASCKNVAGNCADGWGLRIIGSNNVRVYGAGLYSFFNNYSTTCSNYGNGETCQSRIFSLEGKSKSVQVYNLNTIGATSMIDRDGTSLASYADNINVFPDNIALFQSA